MLIRTKLRIGYVVIFTLVVCIGLVMVWALRGWEAAAQDLAVSHAQGLRAERLRGDPYRQIKEILDRFVSGDRSVQQEFDALGIALEGALTDLRRHSRTPEEGERVQALVEAHRQVTSLASVRSAAQAALTGSEQAAEVRLMLQSVVNDVDRLSQWVRHFLFALKPITPTLKARPSQEIDPDSPGSVAIYRPTLLPCRPALMSVFYRVASSLFVYVNQDSFERNPPSNFAGLATSLTKFQT